MRVHRTKDAGIPDYWHFDWLRWKGGYAIEWKTPMAVPPSLLENHPDLKLPFVVLRRGAEQGEVYQPLEQEPGISREFAELAHPDMVIAFANRFGLLGLDEVPRLHAYRQETRKRGENVNLWLKEAAALKRAYLIWDLCEAQNARNLRDVIRWSDDGVIAVFPDGTSLGVADHGALNPGWLKIWKRGDVFGPARLLIAEQFNEHMRQMASPMVLINSKGGFRPHSAPASLLGALWLEFGELITGVRKQAPCELCGKLMDVTENRSHKRMHSHCSLRLRMARYRRSQKE